MEVTLDAAGPKAALLSLPSRIQANVQQMGH